MMPNSEQVTPEDESQKPFLSSSDEEPSPQHTKRENGWTTLLMLAALATTIGSSVPVGYNIGVVNTPAQIIKQFCNETVYNVHEKILTDIELDILWSAVVSIFIVGGVIGSLTGGWVADKLGRKGAVLVNNVLGIVAALFFVLSKELNSVEILVIGRFIVGLSCGLITGTVPMYLTELSPLCLRGAMGVMCPLGITVGVMLGQIMGLKDVLGTENTWHYLLALYALLIIFSATALPILPESPKYLFVIKYEEERAKKELSRVRDIPADQLEHELEMLRIQRDMSENKEAWSSWRVLTDSKLRLPLLLVCALQGGQQFSGINAVFYYSVSIFETAGLTNTQAQYASLGAGAVNLFVAILSVYLVNHYGRRILALLSCTTAILCLILLTVSITYIKSLFWMPYVSIAAVLLYVFFYGLGLGPIPYFIGSELFETGPRPVAMAWGSMSNWAGNFVVGMTFPTLQTAIGQFSFIIFVIIIILLTVFLKMYFPETRDRDQSEIAALLQFGFKSDINRKVNERNAAENPQLPLSNRP